MSSQKTLERAATGSRSEKTAVNCHRLKLWVDPNGGKLKPTQKKVNS